mmetsp:Transcript_1701/g.3709  ORF Transcript_1701/g.3709 Transcript_1701/m.3709 type:complete len:673 (+) Transcript_1701:60-2078(+)
MTYGSGRRVVVLVTLLAAALCCPANCRHDRSDSDHVSHSARSLRGKAGKPHSPRTHDLRKEDHHSRGRYFPHMRHPGFEEAEKLPRTVHARVESGNRAHVAFEIDGTSFTFDLVPMMLYSADGGGVRYFGAGANMTEIETESSEGVDSAEAFHLASDDRQAIAYITSDGKVHGFFHHQDSAFMLQPADPHHARGDKHGYRQHYLKVLAQDRDRRLDVIEEETHAEHELSAGLQYLSGNLSQNATGARPREAHGSGRWQGTRFWPGCYPLDQVQHFLKIRIIIDVKAMQIYPNAAVRLAEEMVAMSNYIFENQLNIQLQIKHLDVYTDAATAPSYGGNNCGNPQDYTVYLDQRLRAMENANANSDAAVTMMLTGCGSAEGVVGYANVGALCSDRKGGATMVIHRVAGAAPWLTFAHELAHVIGADHAFDDSPDGQTGGQTGGIMDYYRDGRYRGETQFHPSYTKPDLCSALSDRYYKCGLSKFEVSDASYTPTTSTPVSTHYNDGNYYGGWRPSAGLCVRDPDEPQCIVSPGYLEGEDYPNNHFCSIECLDVGTPIRVTFWKVRGLGDPMTINGQDYGSNKWESAPHGVVPTGSITWTTDGSKSRPGWRMCRDPDNTTAPGPGGGEASTTSSASSGSTSASVRSTSSSLSPLLITAMLTAAASLLRIRGEPGC